MVDERENLYRDRPRYEQMTRSWVNQEEAFELLDHYASSMTAIERDRDAQMPVWLVSQLVAIWNDTTRTFPSILGQHASIIERKKLFGGAVRYHGWDNANSYHWRRTYNIEYRRQGDQEFFTRILVELEERPEEQGRLEIARLISLECLDITYSSFFGYSLHFLIFF